MSACLFPVFLKLAGRPVLLVGGGGVAAAKLRALLDARADVTVVAPQVGPEILATTARVRLRAFEESDVDGAWLVIAAATPEVNRRVRAAGDSRRVFVNAVDDPEVASAYTGGVLRKGGATLAVSTEGRAPALAGLLREGLEAVLPDEIETWVAAAQALRERQKADGVPLGERRPLLLEALNRLYALKARRRMIAARVSLVGAGPGDPELITLRGARRLAEADLVLYDALVDPRLLDLAPRAQRFPVGKRAGRPSIRQETIHALMIRAARRGRRVVRLKAGDPFVLGRGGEEALALLAAGVPFEVVPGLSSALAAPALAGIPITHRGLASSFLVLSGHDEDAWRPPLTALPPGSATVVVLMGLRARAGIGAALLRQGWAPSTPAAILLAAGTPAARSWRGRLEALAEAAAPIESDGSAGVIVVGAVVDLAGAIAEQEEPWRRHSHTGRSAGRA